MPKWDESMVREGCVCGHGQYNHGPPRWLAKILGQRTNCIRCSCPEFRRDRGGDRSVVEAPDADCLCGEINARHCPVHNEAPDA